MKKWIAALVLPPILLCAPATTAASLRVTDLRCEYRVNPLGIDARNPDLSWRIESSRRGEIQTAYCILVASSRAKLDADTGDLWDSGQIDSDQSIHLHYRGKPLTSGLECSWKVRVWDRNGKPSAWSSPASWSMGLLDGVDWETNGPASWIGLDEPAIPAKVLRSASWIWFPEGNPASSAPVGTRYFRRTVNLPAGRDIRSARWWIAADNEFVAFINEHQIGTGNNFKSATVLDVTAQLRPGNNGLAVAARNSGDQPNPAGLIGALRIEFADGKWIEVSTDRTWKASDHETIGWQQPGFDESGWRAAQELGQNGIAPWGEVTGPEDRRLPARYLRREFKVDRKIRRATAYVCGLGLFEFYLNGKKVGDHVLEPALSEYTKRAYYVTFDVTSRLKQGPNAAGVILGSGRYFAPRTTEPTATRTFGCPKLLFKLHVEFEDGSIADIASDDIWKLTTNGPIRANNEYDGEEYDARMELDAWSKPGFDDSAWQRARIVGNPDGPVTHARIGSAVGLLGRLFGPGSKCQMSAQTIEPIRVTQTLTPQSVKELSPGVYIFDLGQNIVGRCRLTVHGPRGTRVTLRHAETLKPDGSLYVDNLRSAKVTDTYILKGVRKPGPNQKRAASHEPLGHSVTGLTDTLSPSEGKRAGVRGSGTESRSHSNASTDFETEVYEPRFTYHGFRFVELRGYPGKPDLSTIQGRVVHDDLESAGDWMCSNPLLNRICANVRWGVRGNYRSIPTDCPQRDERQGWLGDRSEESKGETYLFNTAGLYGKWLQDMADAQKDNGSVPDVCPPYWPFYSDNVTWPSSSVIIPDHLYEQYADADVVARHYPSMKKWIDYMSGFINGDLMPRDTYGDWCVPPADPKLIHSLDPAQKTAPTILGTTYFYHCLELMARYATLLGKVDAAAHYRNLAAKLKIAFNQKFLKPDGIQYDNGSQTSCVLPLAFGLVPTGDREKVFNHLVDKITHESHSHVGTGLIGGQWLMRTLADNGRTDLAYALASQQTYPSWGYMIAKGATTIWELWNGDTADPAMNSGNHVMLVGDLITWMYEDLAGIKPDPAQPGFKKVVMRPQPAGDLQFVRASHRAPYGLVVSNWKIRNGTFSWTVELPPNTTATVYVPATDLRKVTESGVSAKRAPGVEFRGIESGRVVFVIGSGRYHFVSRDAVPTR